MIESETCGQRLTPGIKTLITVANGPEFPIELSTGTLTRPVSCRYDYDAVVPAAPWRKPTSQESAILTSGVVPEDYGSAISLVSLPRSILQPFEPLREAAAMGADSRGLDALLAGSTFDDAMHSVMNYARTQLRPSDDIEPAEELNGGIYLRAPAQCTVTTDPNSGKHVGLHVDNWSDYPISKRCKAPNRITINLGCEDRFLLFMNIAIGGMYERVKVLVPGVCLATAIGRVFMSLFSSYPVARLRIRPGEGYIAPTENIVHDASTAGTTAWDITLSLRGRIALVPRIEPGIEETQCSDSADIQGTQPS
jgi:hypothetical protein